MLVAAATPDDVATLIWCCKESAFKAWSNAAAGIHGVEPEQVEISLAPIGDEGVWTAAALGQLRAQVS